MEEYVVMYGRVHCYKKTTTSSTFEKYEEIVTIENEHVEIK